MALTVAQWLENADNAVSAIGSGPRIYVGIPFAILGATFMALGAQLQHRGIAKGKRTAGRSTIGVTLLGGFLAAVRQPAWMLGTILLGVAVTCQLGAIYFAPLIIVQPLGALSLVLTTLLNARETGRRPSRQSRRAITVCLFGILSFVTLAAFAATDTATTEEQLWVVLGLLLAVLFIFAVLGWLVPSKNGPLFYIVGAGVLYGFVATFAKFVLSRYQLTNVVDLLTIACVLGLILALASGAYFVHVAYTKGPPDLAIAGLTVIDPIVAVLIGVTILGEAQGASILVMIGFALAGATAVYGVVALARSRPNVVETR